MDLAIHSYKDLGHLRPPGISLGRNHRAGLRGGYLIHQKGCGVPQFSSLSQLVVGTSSPRRMANIKRHLAPLLPGQSVPDDCQQGVEGQYQYPPGKALGWPIPRHHLGPGRARTLGPPPSHSGEAAKVVAWFGLYDPPQFPLSLRCGPRGLGHRGEIPAG